MASPSAATQKGFVVIAAIASDNLEAIRVEFVKIRDVLAENGWDTRSPAYSDLVAQVEATASQPDSLGARFARIVRAEVESCR